MYFFFIIFADVHNNSSFVDVADIVEKLEFAIEQHPSFLKVLTPEEYAEQEAALDKERTFWKS